MERKIFDKKTFNKEMSQLISSVNYIEEKFSGYYLVLDSMGDEKKNYIFIRNLNYFNIIIDRIKCNFAETMIYTKLLKKTNNKLSEKTKEKFKRKIKLKSIISSILLKHLLRLLNKYSIDKFDFEVQSIVDSEEHDLISSVPDKYKNLIHEEFSTINGRFNIGSSTAPTKTFEHLRRVRRGFRRFTRRAGRGIRRVARKAGSAIKKGANFASAAIRRAVRKAVAGIKAAYNKVKNFAKNMINKISKIFKSMFEGIKKIFGFVKKIGQFMGNLLLNFIKMFWKLMKFLFDLSTKYIPKFISSFFSFWKLLYIKFKKTGMISYGVYTITGLLLTKYAETMFGGLTIPGPNGLAMPVPPITDFIEQPIDIISIFITANIFWTQTRFLDGIQQKMFNFLNNSPGLVKAFFVNVLMLPDDRAFSPRRMSVTKRIGLFVKYIYNNLIQIIIRLFCFIAAVSVALKFGIPLVLKNVPDARDILLMPIILIKVLLKLFFGLIFPERE